MRQNKKTMEMEQKFKSLFDGSNGPQGLIEALEKTFEADKKPDSPQMIFQFSFSSRTHYAFSVTQSQYKTEEELGDFVCNGAFPDFVCKSEEKYGIHDYNDSPNPAVLSIGYQSDEIKSKNHLIVMNNFKEFFKGVFGENSTSDIFKIPNKVFNHGDSLDIWKYIKDMEFFYFRKLLKMI